MNPHSRVAMAPVPPTRIDFSEADREWIAERIKEVLTTGRLTLGPYGEAFEDDPDYQAGMTDFSCLQSGKVYGPDEGDVNIQACSDRERGCYQEY